jgi:hypothetical protein
MGNTTMRFHWAPLIALLTVAAIISGCSYHPGSNPPPPPVSGIRVHTFVSGPGGFNIIAADVEGQVVQDLGSGTGSQLSINGSTSSFGLADFPQAKTNAIWDIKVFFSTSNFSACLATDSGNLTIPNGDLLDLEIACSP